MSFTNLSIYSELIKGKIKHYRDANGLECDAIIALPNSKWCAIEIKIGGLKQEQEATKTLTKFINKVEESNNYESPTFSMVITAYGQPRLSKEGVFIVPITCLCE